MEVMQKTSVEKWTWADLLSSYRFWGLVLYFITFASSQYFMGAYSSLFIRENSGLSLSTIGVVYSSQQFGMFFGVILAWIASRIKNIYPLYLLSALILLGFYLFSFNLENLTILIVAEVLVGLSQGAVLLVIPALIAGAVRSVEAFVLSFGLMVTLKLLINMCSLPLLSFLFSSELFRGGALSFFLILSVPVFIGTMLLLPVKSSLFYEAPPLRAASSQPPKYREPVVTFLLFCIPFYNIYWFVKVHAEIRNFTRSSHLLTPKAAGWLMFFLPLVGPIIFSTLSDNLRAIIESNGQVARYKTWLVVLFAFLLPPVSAALIQSQMNEVSGNLGQSQPVLN